METYANKYLIKGSKSLLEAAFKECEVLKGYKKYEPLNLNFNCVKINPERDSYQLAINNQNRPTEYVNLFLPQDWDKMIEIIKSLIPVVELNEYVSFYDDNVNITCVGKINKKNKALFETYELIGVLGDKRSSAKGSSTPLNKEEFIALGKKELEKKGYFYGSRFNPIVVEDEDNYTLMIKDILYIDKDLTGRYPASSVQRESVKKGFCFYVRATTGDDYFPVNEIELVPVPEYVEYGGITYKVDKKRNADKEAVFCYRTNGTIFKGDVKIYKPSTRRAFIKQGIDEFKKAGYLKGVQVSYESDWGVDKTIIHHIEYRDEVSEYQSGLTIDEIEAKGFCFTISDGKQLSIPVNLCKIVKEYFSWEGNKKTAEVNLVNTRGSEHLALTNMRLAADQLFFPSYLVKEMVEAGLTDLYTKFGRIENKDLKQLLDIEY